MNNGAESYFENGVLSADPVELVRMLYRGCVDAVEKARQHLREGDIAARSAQITRAGAIIAHLTFSVNQDADPTMGANLVELYDYMQRRLLRANLDQADAPLAEVSRLLSTLMDAWAACGPLEAGAVQTTPTWADTRTEPVETAAAGEWSEAFGDGTHAGTANGGDYGQTAGAGAYGQTFGASAYAGTSGAGAYGQPVDSGLYAGAGPAETTGAGLYAGTDDAAAYSQPVDAGVYSQTVGAGAYSQTVDAGVYSQTVGAGAYVPTTGAGAYAQPVAPGGYGDQEQEVEYAGKSWDF